MTQSTEDAARRYRGMDGWPVPDILNALWNGQMQAVAACYPALPALAEAVTRATERLAGGTGRIVYSGAGSSGVIAALDGVDLGSTFDWPDDRVLILLAGGLDLAAGLAPEAEDSDELGRRLAGDHAIRSSDVVVGVSASGNSPFTTAIVDEARQRGALSIALTSVPGSPLANAADHVLAIATGAEVLAGSTRLGAGTAQKVMLNLFSTALMTGLGCVYDNLMVNLRPDNAKLRRRALAIVTDIARVDETRAAKALERQGDVKRAILDLAGVARADIPSLLAASGGNLRRALEAAKAHQNG